MTDTANKPDEMVIDVPARDGTLLHLTMRRDDAGLFTEDSPVEIQIHTSAGLRPAANYRAVAFGQAARWIPGRVSQLQLHDLEPGLTIESHWLTTVTDWTMMAAEADLDIWSKPE